MTGQRVIREKARVEVRSHTLNFVFADVDEGCWIYRVAGEVVYHDAEIIQLKGSLYIESSDRDLLERNTETAT